jgi:opacity protein-like surface antigen
MEHFQSTGTSMRLGLPIALSIVLGVVLGTSSAHAQDPSRHGLSISAVRLDYDLAGVGTAAGLAVRTTHDLSSNVSLELGGVFAKPEQQFGPSSLFMPEAQLRYRWQVGRFTPYVGGGVGTALVRSSFHSDWDPTLSASVGTGVRLTDQLDLTGEFRLRGHEWRAVGTSSELSLGLGWRLPSF